MSLYSVYARDSAVPAAIADRFSWFAALLPPVFALVHGLWALLAGWVVAMAAIAGFAVWSGGEAAFWLYVLVAAFVGLEAGGFRRGKLARQGWIYRTEIVARDSDQALVAYLSRDGK